MLAQECTDQRAQVNLGQLGNISTEHYFETTISYFPSHHMLCVREEN